MRVDADPATSQVEIRNLTAISQDDAIPPVTSQDEVIPPATSQDEVIPPATSQDEVTK